LNALLLKDLIRLDEAGERIESMLDPSLSITAFLKSRNKSRSVVTARESIHMDFR